MIRRTIEVILSSCKMAAQELWKNKLRTFLSLFGITIGIFCIIGVLATVNSLEQNIKNEVNSLGSNTIYVDKWLYTTDDDDYPWWKYVNRPYPKFEEVKHIQERTPSAKYTVFRIATIDNVDYKGSSLSNVNLYGVTEDFENIQALEVPTGRYISPAEFDRGANVVVLGDKIATELFGSPELSLEKEVVIRGKKLQVIGVIKKQGSQMIGGWDFDQSVVMPYRFSKTIMREDRSDPVIMVQGKENLSSKVLKDDLAGTMRALHKLSPTKEDDFALNDINDLTESISSAFVSLNIGGWSIAALSLIVGMFGVANIMFVSVRERTSQIGLKKAIGAKSYIILTEFLIESAFLCIIGGLIGLALVFLLTQILTASLDFPVYISTGNMILAIVICVIVGILAGFIPASQAARMDPVVAIRSK
ncbi:ABC transporter permease [Terrimonas sp. NA20]|uniref:ABC transporter permease n=1 Tax=Terrimonas ginsenosidimutans TaxID=2908004 RepID=A0ABS9KSV3_9BACT|nr:ABC transporter permease [Terrimonas ginsenosidimutans]MCG2615412.1 ABC transporter permease [Terrimonas ginsenosidimutans]